MKLSDNTIAILQNFASISPNLWIEPGNELVTISKASAGKAVFAKAEVEDTFPQEFGIYDLNLFLSVLSLHKDPELEFDAKNIYIKGFGGKSKLTYRMAAKDLLELPKGNSVILPSVDITFLLEEDDLTWIMNTVKVLKSPNIAIRSDGKTNISLVGFDAKNDSRHIENLEICGASGCNGSVFDYWFASDNWQRIIPGTYEVKVSGRGIAEFKHQATKLEYVIKMEAKP
jgi:hypothetical protein